MLIDLSSFLNDDEMLLPYKGELDPKDLELDLGDISIIKPIIYEGEIYKADGERLINGKMTFIYRENCHRCLKPMEKQIKAALFGKLVEGKEEYGEEDNAYDELVFYENDILDLKEYIKNQVLVSLPMKSLCEDDCKGLCPRCGVDLNNTNCDCIQEDIDPRLEKLKNFFPKN